MLRTCFPALHAMIALVASAVRLLFLTEKGRVIEAFFAVAPNPKDDEAKGLAKLAVGRASAGRQRMKGGLEEGRRQDVTKIEVLRSAISLREFGLYPRRIHKLFQQISGKPTTLLGSSGG